MIKVVTGYVPVPGSSRTAGDYRTLAEPLFRLRDCGIAVESFYSAVEDCWFYKAIKDSGITPSYAVDDNPAKNTLDYHIAIHQKTFWLADAACRSDAAVVVWIDYGIFHLSDLKLDHVVEFLERAREEPSLAMPGCWHQAERPADRPNWRFCGGLVVAARSRLGPLHEAVKRVSLKRLVQDQYVTWEVNDWAAVEDEMQIRWYEADHDRTMFTNYKPVSVL